MLPWAASRYRRPLIAFTAAARHGTEVRPPATLLKIRIGIAQKI